MHAAVSAAAPGPVSFCVLGSGSGGNCTHLVLRGSGRPRHVLIDCGLSVRATAARLAAVGCAVDDVTDVVLTHLDHDHLSRGWVRRIRKAGIDVHLHRQHRNRAVRMGITGHTMRLYRERFRIGDGVEVEPVLLAHDDLGAVGFVIEHANVRLGFATDLGRVPRTLLDAFVDLDAVAIESNYDPVMQMASPRTARLKRRITGGRGHLSNEESLEAVLAIAKRSRLAHVVPLHVSRQCNDPRLIERLYATAAPHLRDRLTIAAQTRPTPVLHVTPFAGARRCGDQLMMFGERR